jgi:hypothetical protein
MSGYRAVKTEEAAKRWFAILPGTNVVLLPAIAAA